MGSVDSVLKRPSETFQKDIGLSGLRLQCVKNHLRILLK